MADVNEKLYESLKAEKQNLLDRAHSGEQMKEKDWMDLLKISNIVARLEDADADA